MSALRDALVQYVALRRALGTQLQEPAWNSLSARERSSSPRNLPSVGRWNPNLSNVLHGHAVSAW